ALPRPASRFPLPASRLKFHTRRIQEQPVVRIRTPLLVSLLAAIACNPRVASAPSPASVPDPAKYVTAIADDYLAAYREAFPEINTSQGIPGARHDRLTDNSAAAELAW